MAVLQISGETPRRKYAAKRELYRETCQDEEGNRHIVIVWQNKPGLSTVSYSLDDGTPVHYEDDCHFATPSGQMLTRCED
ncbi:MAG: hypothetical protein EOP23_09840 [Hyphomicrobiales bacterium]|nr:MAG: hypothetical protein EOP23_09840 [Hyphomicrobiales bacterium]